jgi:putative restriction endonuclease
MRAYIANTDYDWWRFLRDRPHIDEVNFWQPGGTQAFRSLSPGEPLIFRLKRPYNALAGVGFFAHFSQLPVSLAWSAFGEKNGVESEAAMRRRVEMYRRRFGRPPDPKEDYVIGCVILAEPRFFEEGTWLPQPGDWRGPTVRGRGEDLSAERGQEVWASIAARLRLGVSEPSLSTSARYGALQVIQPRLGQGAFRILVTDTYGRRCAVTRERTLPVLEAAHVKPYALGGLNNVTNGILFRSDLHTLFDRGYITVTKEHRLEVSRRIREEYENGREYYALHGREVIVPRSEDAHPDPHLLDWHNVEVFKG